MRDSSSTTSIKLPTLLRLCVLSLTLLIAACTEPRSNEEIAVAPEVIEAPGRYQKQYLLVPGDSIEISIWNVPEISRIVVIRPDGLISLPTVSGIRAAGLTFEELELELTHMLSDRLSDPQVTVIGVKLREGMVYVVGDVPVQRAVPLRDASTAMQAITLAGGFSRSGARGDVAIIRVGDDGILRAIPVDVPVDSQPSSYLALSMVRLQPDDIVFVPESGRGEVVRFLDDFIGRPLSYINMIGNSYINWRIIRDN